LLLTHVWAIGSAWSTLETESGSDGWFSLAVRLFALSASAVFFILKIADVRWLRLKPGWRSMTTALIVVGLLHVSVLERELEGRSVLPPGPVGLVLCVGTLMGLEAEGLRRLLRRLMVTQGCDRPTPERHPFQHPCGFSIVATWAPALMLVLVGYLAPRAPPIS
jgi:hypothetical protein